jgi:hypothetical protein
MQRFRFVMQPHKREMRAVHGVEIRSRGRRAMRDTDQLHLLQVILFRRSPVDHGPVDEAIFVAPGTARQGEHVTINAAATVRVRQRGAVVARGRTWSQEAVSGLPQSAELCKYQRSLPCRDKQPRPTALLQRSHVRYTGAPLLKR